MQRERRRGCWTSARRWPRRSSCRGPRPFPLGPDDAYAESLGGVFEDLESESSAGEAALREADTPDGQGAAATRLARAYTKAAGALAEVEVSPRDAQANAAIVAALRATGRAYKRMGAAARAGDGAAYTAASDAVERGGKRLERAQGELEELGYSTG